MGISSGTSTRWFFIRYIQIKLEFWNAGFSGEGKTWVPKEKSLGERMRTNNKLNPHVMMSTGIEPLTTVPSLLPQLDIMWHHYWTL